MAGGPRRRLLYVETNEDGTVGGSYVALHLLVTHLDRSCFEPVVLYYQDNPDVRRLRDAGVDVHVWESERERERRPGRLLTRLASAVARRARWLRDRRIDLVHLNGSPWLCFHDWLPAAHLARVPCITHARQVLAPSTRSVSRWLAGRFDRVIAISDYVERALEEQGLPRDRIRRIHDGIDVEGFRASVKRSPAEVRDSLGVAGHGLLAVMVGHLRAWKGQHVVLEALARMDPMQLPPLWVAFAGDAPQGEEEYRAALTARVEQLGLAERVLLLGHREDVADLMNAADVVLHASLTPEPFGLVAVEALALGKPLVAADRGGPVEIVTPGSGLLFDPDAPDSLASVLSDLCSDPARRAALAAGARARAEAFGAERNASAMQAVYRELLSMPEDEPAEDPPWPSP